MTFSADDIETVQQMFVQAFCFDGQSKFSSRKFVTAVKRWTMEREVCQKMAYTDFQNGGTESMFTIATFGTVLPKGVWT
jgi:hypothetical protein